MCSDKFVEPVREGYLALELLDIESLDDTACECVGFGPGTVWVKFYEI